MWVTAYCDASFSPAQGGAWAVWLTSAEGRVVKRGSCPNYVHDSNAAELAALFAAVFLGCRAWPGKVKGIVLRSDSQSALYHATPTAKLARNDSLRRLQTRLRALQQEFEVVIETQWVRGHQPRSTSSQAFLNGACDELANKTRRLNPTRPSKAGAYRRRRL